MSSNLSPGDLRFRQIMNDAARRIAVSESPYDLAIGLMGDLAREVLTTADFSGGAYAMWGWLTDGLDGPPRYARGLTGDEIEDLMRLAAKEWLDLDLSPESVRRYLARWEDWPDSVRKSPGDAYL
jgi:hypothetical protein